MDRHRVHDLSVMEEFMGRCATCEHWTGARVSGLVDSHGACLDLEMHERATREAGEDSWYVTAREHSCDRHEPFVPFRVGADGTVTATGMNPFQTLSEARATGFDIHDDLERMFGALLDRIDGEDEPDGADLTVNVPLEDDDPLSRMLENLFRLNFLCDEPAYMCAEAKGALDDLRD